MAFLGLLMVGCSSQTWMAGPNQNLANFEQTKAECQLDAQNSGTTFAAYGSQGYVAGAAVGHALGDALRAASVFNACMRAAGFIPLNQKGLAIIADKKDRIKIAATEKTACLFRVRADRRYTTLVDRLPDVRTGKYTLHQLADDSLATDSDAQTLISYFDATTPCSDRFIQEVDAVVPGSGAILSASRQEAEVAIIDLAHRQLSWGAASRKSQDVSEQAQEKLRHLPLL